MTTSPPSTDRSRSVRWPRRAVAVVAALVVGLVAAVPGAGPAGATVFGDVPPGHPFAVPIDWAVTAGVTGGYDDGTFRPTVPVSRQALAAFLARYDDGGSGSEPEACEGEGPFTDVPVSHPFCAEISWLVDLGITTGFGDGTFRPTDPISRQAMAAFLARYAADGEPEACEGDGPFDDVASPHPFCAEITWMVNEGITTGFDDNTFRPTVAISRQAAAAFLWRLDGEPTGATVRVSVSSAGEQGTGLSDGSTISADGTTVAFTSSSAELVAGDTNGHQDVFVHVLATGVTERVSVASDGSQADGSSAGPAISADGRFVAFQSAATNLAPGVPGGVTQVYAHDRLDGTTELVSRSSGGEPGSASSGNPAISHDGRFVAFRSDADDLVDDDKNETVDVFVHDRHTGVTELISRNEEGEPGNDWSVVASISGDGRYVTFATGASDIVKGNDPIWGHAVLHDRHDGTNSLLSQSIGGEPAEEGSDSFPSGISADGSVVAFWSNASNLVEGDTNDTFDVFVLDRNENTLERVSVASDGSQSNGDSFTGEGGVSADGRVVVFASDATDLVPDHPGEGSQAYAHDRRSGVTEPVSVSVDGADADGFATSFGLGVSGDGRLVVFASWAENLVADDTNGLGDVFVRTRFGAG